MSKIELTFFGEKGTLRKSKEPTFIMTANGKAESTEEATVYVNDFDVFVTGCCWKMQEQCRVQVYYAKKWTVDRLRERLHLS